VEPFSTQSIIIDVHCEIQILAKVITSKMQLNMAVEIVGCLQSTPCI